MSNFSSNKEIIRAYNLIIINLTMYFTKQDKIHNILTKTQIFKISIYKIYIYIYFHSINRKKK